jgi:hypothetical protein
MYCPLFLAAAMTTDHLELLGEQGFTVCQEEHCAWWVPPAEHNVGYSTYFETQGHCIVQEVGPP